MGKKIELKSIRNSNSTSLGFWYYYVPYVYTPPAFVGPATKCTLSTI